MKKFKEFIKESVNEGNFYELHHTDRNKATHALIVHLDASGKHKSHNFTGGGGVAASSANYSSDTNKSTQERKNHINHIVKAAHNKGGMHHLVKELTKHSGRQWEVADGYDDMNESYKVGKPSLQDFQRTLKSFDDAGMKHIKKTYPDHHNVSMYNNSVKQHGDNKFSYEYDGFITSVTQFNDDGSVTEWEDVIPSELKGEKGNNYKSVEAWKSHHIKMQTMDHK